MTAPHVIDPAGMLGEALSQVSPDLMCSLLQHVINALLSARLTRCAGPSGANKTRSVTPGAMCIATGPWTPGSAPLTWAIPQAARHLLSRVVASTPQTLRKRLDHSGRPLLLSGSIHVPYGQARQNPGDHGTVEVLGLTYGPRPGRTRGRVPSLPPR